MHEQGLRRSCASLRRSRRRDVFTLSVVASTSTVIVVTSLLRRDEGNSPGCIRFIRRDPDSTAITTSLRFFDHFWSKLENWHFEYLLALSVLFP